MSDAHKPARWGGGSGKKSVQAHQGTAPPAPPEPVQTGPDATDAAKALAAEHSVDLTFVVGTGQDGRITKDDVAATIEPPAEPEPAEPVPDEADTPAAKAAAAAAEQA